MMIKLNIDFSRDVLLGDDVLLLGPAQKE